MAHAAFCELALWSDGIKDIERKSHIDEGVKRAQLESGGDGISDIACGMNEARQRENGIGIGNEKNQQKEETDGVESYLEELFGENDKEGGESDGCRVYQVEFDVIHEYLGAVLKDIHGFESEQRKKEIKQQNQRKTKIRRIDSFALID